MKMSILRPMRPSSLEWENLILQKKGISPNFAIAIVDIILPVYGAPDDTLRCLYSVLATKNTTPFNLIVIDDCSPDEELSKTLRELSLTLPFEFHQNKENKGFVLTCNLGFSLNPNRDIILLNSDTEVFDGWVDKIMACATNNPDAGTITAMSNNATICSYPFFCEDYSFPYEISDSELNQLFDKVNGTNLISAPTGVGFCMYIRRKCLDKVGGFNYELFGKGYGEENDLCIRIEKAGWQNMIATGLFVRHYGSSSFSGTVREERVNNALQVIQNEHPSYLSDVARFIDKDPIRLARKRVDEERLKQYLALNKPVCLHIVHSYGGGTEKHHIEMAGKLEQEGYSVLSFKPNKKGGLSLSIGGKFDLPNLNLPQTSIELAQWLIEYRISFVHFHHLKGFDNKIIDVLFQSIEITNIPYYFTVHDYYSICPRINLIDETNLFCGEPDEKECNNCIKTCYDARDYTIQRWRNEYSEILTKAKRVFVPDEDVQWRLSRYFPALKCTVRPHFDIWLKNMSVSQYQYEDKNRNKDSRKIGILGAIGIHKGFEQIFQVASIAEQIGLDWEFIIIGNTCSDESLKNLKNIKIKGGYQDSELLQLIFNEHLDVLWFPAVWPETYSYTMSAALASGLPIVAFDFGAIARRLHEVQNGGCVPLEIMLKPAKIIPYLMQDYQRITNKQSIPIQYQSFLQDYYEK